MLADFSAWDMIRFQRYGIRAFLATTVCCGVSILPNAVALF